MNSSTASPEEWALPKVIKKEIVQEGFIKIRIETLELASQEQHRYYTIDPKSDAVLILCQTAENELVLIEEYRHPTGKILLSCAGGYIEPLEDVLVAAQRELLEETGYEAEFYHHIGQVYPYPGLSSQKIYFVYAQNGKKVASPQHEPLEILKVRLKKESDLKNEIALGINLDGVFCAGLLFYDLWKSRSS